MIATVAFVSKDKECLTLFAHGKVLRGGGGGTNDLGTSVRAINARFEKQLRLKFEQTAAAMACTRDGEPSKLIEAQR